MSGEFDRDEARESGAGGAPGPVTADLLSTDRAGVDRDADTQHLDAVAGGEFVDDRLRLGE
jgi:hypothetical protein